jgi:hypothetical protein
MVGPLAEIELQEHLDKLALLGEPTAEFTVSGWLLLRRLAVALLLILLGAGLLVLAFFLKVFSHFHFLAFAGFLILTGIMLVVRTYLNLGGRVLVYPEGAIHFRRDKVASFFWDDVVRICFTKTGGDWSRIWQGSHSIFLQLGAGKDIHFDDSLPRLKELYRIIQEATLPYLWPPARASFEAGETLWFGGLQLNHKGLARGKESLPWENIDLFAINQEEIAIYKKGKAKHWYHTAISDIPNFHVLRSLVNHAIVIKNLRIKGQPGVIS